MPFVEDIEPLTLEERGKRRERGRERERERERETPTDDFIAFHFKRNEPN